MYDKNLVAEDVDLGTVEISIDDALSISRAVMSEAAYQQSQTVSTASIANNYLQHAPTEVANVDPSTFKPSAPPPPPNAFASSHPEPVSDLPYRGASRDTFADASFPSGWRHSSGLVHSGPAAADVLLQRNMTRSYSVSQQGRINIVVAPGWLADLAGSAPRNHFKRFQTHKFSEQVGNIGKIPFQNKVGNSVGKVLKSGAAKSKSLHAALDVLQPVQSAFQEHSTWKIEMRDVVDIFGEKRHPWNRDYQAAQKIFQGKASIVTRRVVQMQHAYLYGGASGIKPLVHVRKDLLEITGNILDAQDFLNLMEYGIRRGKPRMFTYVLMPGRLYVAETGAKFFRDMMSKHAMHCSASPEVVYAGELHFRHSPVASGTEIRLIIDNNSGTYAPGKEDLPLVEEVFRRNFAGLHVTALDFQDPLLVQYSNELLHSTEHLQSSG